MEKIAIFHGLLILLVVVNSEKTGPPPEKGKCSSTSRCVPFIHCPIFPQVQKRENCTLNSLRPGVCCPADYNSKDKIVERGRLHGSGRISSIDSTTLDTISRNSRAEMSRFRSLEAKLLSGHRLAILKKGTASYSHYRNSRMFDMADLADVMGVANKALEIAVATRVFKDRQGLSNQQLELGLIEQELHNTPLGNNCAMKPFCAPKMERYRRIDGACNNAEHPLWGAPLSPYARILPPSYRDGIWIPRDSVRGHPLASPRLISTTIFDDKDIPHYEHTLMVTQFGQFLSHDLTFSVDMSFGNGSAISCCTQDGDRPLHPSSRHFACMEIEIPRNDPFYGVFNQGCMNFVRSVLAPRHDCTLGYAQQMNKITHFMDASSVYGSNPEQTGKLRSFIGGRLNVFDDFGRDLLPLSEDKDACLTTEQGSACFTSGDTRTNQMISLAALHTLFLREHNRIAGILSELNPHWSDELVFLESRQVVMAELQVIVYKEFLPAVIGPEAMADFGLYLKEGEEYSTDYDPKVEPSITNEFASAAFRFGHSTVYGLLKLYGPHNIEEMISIPEVMFSPGRIRKRQFFDELMYTITSEPMQEADSSMTETLTKYMFRGGNPFGVDLAAINIQRGRDHGLRPYNDYRELSGLPRMRDFEEFGPENAAKLRSVYSSVDDVDLWVGGLLEERAPGSVVGPVFRDIIAEQFGRLKRGDKYFFENEPSINPGHFTPAQLVELRKVSMSRIVCDNSDGILLARLAPNAFKKPGVPGNEYVDCKGPEIASINFMHWQEMP